MLEDSFSSDPMLAGLAVQVQCCSLSLNVIGCVMFMMVIAVYHCQMKLYNIGKVFTAML